MRILSFDTESSTGCINDGSLCSFGYCIFDERFNLIEQRDIVINPLANFRWQIIGKNRKIDLAYSAKEFYASPRFSFFYNEIKQIFDSCDLVIGFAIENDVKYLRDACEKFSLPQIEYKFVDVKQLLELYGDENKDKGLSAIAESKNIEFIAHRSDEDARVTGLVLKMLSEKHDKSVSEILDYAEYLQGENTQNGYTHAYSLAQLYGRKGFSRTARQSSALFEYAREKAVECYKKGGLLAGKSCCFSKSIKYTDIEYSFGLLKKLYSLSGKFAPCVYCANVYVCSKDDEDDKDLDFAKELIKSGKRIKIMTITEFENLIGEFDKDTFDFLSVIIDYDKKRAMEKKKSKNVKKPIATIKFVKPTSDE